MNLQVFSIIVIILIFLLPGCEQSPSLPYHPEEKLILTPKAPKIPRINGPKIYGVRPGSPFLFRIPCTGERPLEFQAEDLPDELSLNTKSGIITGSISEKGAYHVRLKASNSYGESSSDFRIVVGNKIALTPPMGWNSWYIHYDRISDSLMRQAADQMIKTGMADFGYQYVNIDDCWMIKADSEDSQIDRTLRDDNGRLLTNNRFPDMYSMTDYIHAKGLKAGLYISPGPTTCAGYAGSLGHERQDAETFAEWEFDFLKYDWCSYGKLVNPKTKEDFIKPYREMWNNLQSINRDIVLNLCQYGMGNVWEWGSTVGNCWRTTGDLGLEATRELPGFYYIGLSNAQHWEYAQPGGWNDPDYILIGWVGSAHQMGMGAPTRLTPDEHYSYMSMWCLMAAPLIFSGDMGKLDEFTLNVLCNHEVIEVNQDPLGKQAKILRQSEQEMILVKELQDGSLAVGLFNLDSIPITSSISWTELGLNGKWIVRDLWRQQDIGVCQNSFSAIVTPHGVIFVRLKRKH